MFSMYDSCLQKVTQTIESIATQTDAMEKGPISLESSTETSMRASNRRVSNKNKNSNKNRKRTKNRTKNQSNNKNKVIEI